MDKNQNIIKNKHIRDFFKSKKLLFSPWAAENKFYASYQQWYKPMKEIFGEFISFDPQKTTILYGQKKMNDMFLEIIRKEQPDYILLWIIRSEFYPETILKIREISPKSIVISSNYDDDTQFYDLFRHYSPFFDYVLIGEADFLKKYRQDGIKNVFKFMGVSKQHFRFLNLPKKYDVTFTGIPKFNRYEYIKYLKDNGINIFLSGGGWKSYHELKDIYSGGPIDAENFVKVMNQSKIVLCFSKNLFGAPHFNPRIFEVGSTKSFALLESFKGYLNFFEKDKEIVMFDTKEDLLNKIRYFLKHEKEREKIADNAHIKILKNYSAEIELEKFFSEVYKQSNNFKHQPFPKINKKAKYISKNQLFLGDSKLKELLNGFDYIGFDEGDVLSQHKDYMQMLSLEKSKKPISCCDYFVYSRLLGNLFFIYSKESFNSISEKDFFKLIKLSQIMVKKDYFIKNINSFRDFSKKNKKLFKKEDCVFVSIPLVYTKKFNSSIYKSIKTTSSANYLLNIKTLMDKKSIFTSPYLYLLTLDSLFTRRFFILRDIFKEGIKYMNSYLNKGK